MELDVATLIEHGALAVVLWAIIQLILVPMINRLMNRLDVLTDKLIEIASKQETIVNQQAEIIGKRDT